MSCGKTLSGAAAASAIAFVLQGCGSSSDPPTTTPGPTKPNFPLRSCGDNGWAVDECCCMTCPTVAYDAQHRSPVGYAQIPVFNVTGADDCLSAGGQCKTVVTSHFARGPPAKRVHPSLTASAGAGLSEQHHLIGGHPDEVTIVFMLGRASLPQAVQVRVQETGDVTNHETKISSYSFFQNPSGSNLYSPAIRGAEYVPCVNSAGSADYMNATCFYTSQVIHKTTVTDLTPATVYNYRLLTEDTWRTFKTPPAIGDAISIGFTADLGITTDANSTMAHMKADFDKGDLDLIVFPGDLSYADGYANSWDDFGRMGDFLWSAVPTAYGVGNHEFTSGFENMDNYVPRYGWESSQTTSYSPLWYSYDAGLAHVFMLCSYCDFTPGSAQYTWLADDLASVDRDVTPWLVGSLHVPLYTSDASNTMEKDGKEMRATIEQLLFDSHVDIVVQGHVHSYERTSPVFHNETNCAGPVYMTVGDGGNHEGPACGWLDFPWSESKEYSWGYGVLRIHNDTDADWVWHRNQDGDNVFFDSTPLKRASQRCGVVAGSEIGITV